MAASNHDRASQSELAGLPVGADGGEEQVGEDALTQVAPVHVAVLGGDPDPLLEAVGALGALAVELVGPAREREGAARIQATLDEVGVPVTVRTVDPGDTVGWIATFQDMVDRHEVQPGEFLVNLSTAPPRAAPMALCAAYVTGMRAVREGEEGLEMLPALRFGFEDEVSQAKHDILAALDAAGGRVESLKELASHLDGNSSRVSYHIRGNDTTDGLEGLGLVEIHRGPKGALEIRLTPMGRLVARRLVTGS